MLRTLDLFLLTLVRDGINTPYEWQARGGVSLGASLPAVKRLLAGGLVSEAEKGSRGRRKFRIIRSGRQTVQNIDLNFEQALDEAPRDLKSVLRLASMAFSDARTEIGKKLLQQASEDNAKRARRARKQANIPLRESSAAKLYSAALAQCDANRLEASSES